MQLDRKPRLSVLASATAALLCATPTTAGAASETDWNMDVGTLFYSEAGGRVQVVEPVVSAQREFADQRLLSTKLVFDTLSGASPNGATPASRPQTFTGASGGSGAYTTPAYQLPLDPNFKDTRVQGSLDYLFPVSEDGKLGYGVTGSSETDFLSLGGSARYSHDFNRSNTTLSAGLGLEYDAISPVGGAPMPMASRGQAAGGEQGEGGNDDDDEGGEGGRSETKTVVDALLGITQVLDPHSLLQLNYSHSQSSGYHNDPYKILSVVDSNGEPLDYVYESRPDSRSKQALFLRYKRFVLDRDVFEVSARYLRDDWGIHSQTAELSYRWYFGREHYLEPHLRYYQQAAADFYRMALYTGEQQQLGVASADPRLGSFDAYTVGMKLGNGLGKAGRWSLRGEYYQQRSQLTGVPPAAAQGLSKFDLHAADLQAFLLSLGYQFRW